MKLFKFFSVLFILSFFIVACQQKNHNLPVAVSKKNDKKDLIEQNIEATDNMLNNCNIIFDKQRPIIVTSIVNIDNISQSSTFGRISSEIIANRLAQHGYNIKELKMNQAKIYVRKNEGEFVLSREIQEIANRHNVQGIVVGTFAVEDKNFSKEKKVFVSLRIVETQTDRIGCAYCYKLKVTDL